MAFSLSFLSQMRSQKWKSFGKYLYMHAEHCSLALILNMVSPFFATDSLFTIHNLYFCLNNYKKGNERLNRKAAFMILLRELHNEVISSEQTYDTFRFIFSESCCRQKSSSTEPDKRSLVYTWIRKKKVNMLVLWQQGWMMTFVGEVQADNLLELQLSSWTLFNTVGHHSTWNSFQQTRKGHWWS